jgi:hypothetical protein
MSVVDLGRRTGLLSVERTVGLMLEEGEIYFVSGNPIYATFGPLRGHEALQELSRWSECRFCFDPQAPQPIPNVPGVLPAVDHSSPTGFGYQYAPPSGPLGGSPSGPAGAPPFGMSPASSGVYPGYAPNQPSGASSGPPGGWSFPGQSGPSASPIPGPWQSPPPQRYSSGNLGGLASGAGANSGANLGMSGVNWGVPGAGVGSGPLNPETPAGFGGAGPSAPAAASPRTTDPNAQPELQLCPRRAPDVRDLINVVTTYNLTRAHRTILLLADGEHSILDLARLSGKPVDEVTNLLRELEGRGLVYYQ